MTYKSNEFGTAKSDNWPSAQQCEDNADGEHHECNRCHEELEAERAQASVRVEDGVEDAMCRTVDVSFRIIHMKIICCLKFRCLLLNPTVSPLGLNRARS